MAARILRLCVGILLMICGATCDRAFAGSQVSQVCVATEADWSCIYPASNFPPTNEISVPFTRPDADLGTALTCALIAENLGPGTPSNYTIVSVSSTRESSGRFRFSLPRPFPAGRYHAEVTEAGKLLKSLSFTIAPPPAGTPPSVEGPGAARSRSRSGRTPM